MATVIALVALRLVTGWHFFSEGLSHYSDRTWSSEGFLRQAKGPLQPLYHGMLPDFHRWDEYMYGPPTAGPGVTEWKDQLQDDWHEYRLAFVNHYGLDTPAKDETPEQKKQRQQQKDETVKVLARARQQLEAWVAANTGAINENRHVLERLQQAQAEKGAAEVPFQRKRIGDQQAQFRGEIGPLVGQARAIEKDYYNQLRSVLMPEQRQRSSLPAEHTKLDQVDKTLTNLLIGIGAFLIVGLFTRTAAVVGAGFLLSVALAQPFWLHDTIPTYNQYVEMIALLALATTHVGRWGGLDYFIHQLIVEPARSAKSNERASELE